MVKDELSDILLDHFNYPRNIGIIDYPNGQGCNGDPECGDYLEIYIRVENNLIEDISFLVFGCFGAIASGSMTMQLAKGKTLEEAFKISEEDIIQALGGLPEDKKHCSNLGVKALRNAIDDYYSKEKKE